MDQFLDLPLFDETVKFRRFPRIGKDGGPGNWSAKSLALLFFRQTYMTANILAKKNVIKNIVHYIQCGTCIIKHTSNRIKNKVIHEITAYCTRTG